MAASDKWCQHTVDQRTGAIVPRVAARYEVTPDATEYTFYSRQNVPWSDGTPINAHDFEWRWTRVLDPNTISNGPFIMTYLRGTFDADPSGLWSVIARLDGKTGGLVGVYVGLGLISWLTVARIVRANVMSLKQKEYIEAARGLDTDNGRIMLRPLLPNTIAPIVVAATLGIPSAILSEAGISFLGLGVRPPMPSWGLMISEAIPNLRAHPHMLIFPATALSLTVLAFNFIGDRLRDALDPWMKR